MTAAPGFLRWRSWGGADRRALLLHGSTSSSATWWRVGPALAEAGWRVKAPDLPAHGASPRAGEALTPDVAADWLRSELADRPVDLVVGHNFGAAVALALLDGGPEIKTLVLEELPGRQSVDWGAKADAVVAGVRAARRDAQSTFTEIHAAQPDWTEEDCRQAVADLASASAEEIAAGLRAVDRWPSLDAARLSSPTLVLAAPDAPGINRGENATTLRGIDRAAARVIADAFVEIDGGHCLHRDRPDAWLQAVTGFTG